MPTSEFPENHSPEKYAGCPDCSLRQSDPEVPEFWRVGELFPFSEFFQ